MSHKRWILAEWVVYVAAALLVVAEALHLGQVPGGGVDLNGTLWFHWWLPHALLNGLDPAHTDLFFYPSGKDLFTHTGMNVLDAALSAPFQAVFGHPGYLAPFTAAVLVANAWAFRPLVRHFAPVARIVGCLAFELSAYGLGEIEHGRVTQACLFFLPLALYHFLELDRLRWKNAVWAGVFTALAGWTYWYYGFFLAGALAWLTLHGLARHPDRKALLLRYLGAGAVCLALVAPAVVLMAQAAAAGEVPMLGISERTMRLTGLAPAQRDVMFAAPAVIAVVAWVVVGPNRLRWLPILFGAGLLSAGAVWSPGQDMNPWYRWIYDHVPFFSRLSFPYRFLSVYTIPMAFAFAAVVHRMPRIRLPVAALAVAGAAWSARFWLPMKSIDMHPPEILAEMAAEGGAIIDMPFPSSGPLIGWQANHQLPLWGGMGADNDQLWPTGFRQRAGNSFILVLRETAKRRRRSVTRYRPDALQSLIAEGFRWVVLQDEPDGQKRNRAVRDKYKHLLGPPRFEDERLVAWDLLTLPEPQ